MDLPIIEPPNNTLDTAIQAAIDNKTKPLGALGQLERLAFRIARWQGTLKPTLLKPAIAVFAGDHGITEEGVSAFPSAVTAQMVANFLGGGAAINVFTRQHGLDLLLIDAGVNAELPQSENLVARKVAFGTANFRHEPAMTKPQLTQAIESGRDLAKTWQAEGRNIVGFGEMGIGNTSSAAMLMHGILGLPLDDCVGRGTGLNDDGLTRKRDVLQMAVDKHGIPNDPFELLRLYGGFEIAMMCGAMLEAAARRMLLIIDGFIVGSALLIANATSPTIREACIFSHRGAERGHAAMLEHLKAEALLRMDLRLGEGSGAAVAYPLIQSAVSFLNEMATFQSAGVSGKDA